MRTGYLVGELTASPFDGNAHFSIFRALDQKNILRTAYFISIDLGHNIAFTQPGRLGRRTIQNFCNV
ncbi:hypothetical protein D3C77_419140 [compost metagenome]